MNLFRASKPLPDLPPGSPSRSPRKFTLWGTAGVVFTVLLFSTHCNLDSPAAPKETEPNPEEPVEFQILRVDPPAGARNILVSPKPKIVIHFNAIPENYKNKLSASGGLQVDEGNQNPAPYENSITYFITSTPDYGQSYTLTLAEGIYTMEAGFTGEELPTEAMTWQITFQKQNPTAGSAPVNGDWVAFGGGTLTLGDDSSGDESVTPAHNVYLDPFFISKYELTNADYRQCVADGKCCSSTDAVLCPKYATDYRHSRYPRKDYIGEIMTISYPGPPSGEIFTLAYNRGQEQRSVYIATDAGMNYTSDDGTSFGQVTTGGGITSNNLSAVAIAGPDWYLGSASGVDVSNDTGSSWTLRTTGDGLGSNDIRGFHPTGPDTVYAATAGGLSKSVDSGANWTNATTGNGLGSNDVRPGIFALQNYVYAPTAGGISISNDAGSSFTNFDDGGGTPTGLGDNSVNAVFVTGDPTGDNTIYAATDGGLSIATDDGSLTLGTTGSWVNKTTDDGLGSNTVNTVFVYGGRIYAGTTGGLAISSNGGDSFSNFTTAEGLASNNVKQIYVAGNTVYAVTPAGLSYSTNLLTWSSWTTGDGLLSNNITAVFPVYVSSLPPQVSYQNGNIYLRFLEGAINHNTIFTIDDTSTTLSDLETGLETVEHDLPADACEVPPCQLDVQLANPHALDDSVPGDGHGRLFAKYVGNFSNEEFGEGAEAYTYELTPIYPNLKYKNGVVTLGYQNLIAGQVLTGTSDSDDIAISASMDFTDLKNALESYKIPRYGCLPEVVGGCSITVSIKAGYENSLVQEYLPDFNKEDFGDTGEEFQPFGTQLLVYFTNPTYDNYPVVNITWEESKTLCDWYDDGQLNNSAGIPTEAHWEYAAVGGTGTVFDAVNQLNEYEFPAAGFTLAADSSGFSGNIPEPCQDANYYSLFDYNPLPWTATNANQFFMRPYCQTSLIGYSVPETSNLFTIDYPSIQEDQDPATIEYDGTTITLTWVGHKCSVSGYDNEEDCEDPAQGAGTWELATCPADGLEHCYEVSYSLTGTTTLAELESELADWELPQRSCEDTSQAVESCQITVTFDNLPHPFGLSSVDAGNPTAQSVLTPFIVTEMEGSQFSFPAQDLPFTDINDTWEVTQGTPRTVGTEEIYGLMGNVWEWTSSAYQPYPLEKLVEPFGDDPINTDFFVLRGGANNSGAQEIRAVSRGKLGPEERAADVGVRCVRYANAHD